MDTQKQQNIYGSVTNNHQEANNCELVLQDISDVDEQLSNPIVVKEAFSWSDIAIFSWDGSKDLENRSTLNIQNVSPEEPFDVKHVCSNVSIFSRDRYAPSWTAFDIESPPFVNFTDDYEDKANHVSPGDATSKHFDETFPNNCNTTYTLSDNVLYNKTTDTFSVSASCCSFQIPKQVNRSQRTTYQEEETHESCSNHEILKLFNLYADSNSGLDVQELNYAATVEEGRKLTRTTQENTQKEGTTTDEMVTKTTNIIVRDEMDLESDISRKDEIPLMTENNIAIPGMNGEMLTIKFRWK